MEINDFKAEFEIKFDIKTNFKDIESVLSKICDDVSRGFKSINAGKTDVMATATIKKINDNDMEDKVLDINRQIDKLNYKGNISDGSHTFDELYYHRMALFSIICNQNKEFAWKSWKHDDGSMFDDYFIVGITTRNGDYSYHYHKNHWNKFNVKELEFAPKWDGHLPKDIMRLLALLD